MSLGILFIDELQGFYKSKVMAVLLIGLPLISIIMHSIQPEAEGISFFYITSLLIAALGGLICSVTLATSITSEMIRHVYDLFLIRPVRRWSILLSKFFAILTCVLVATGLSFIVGYSLDVVFITLPNEAIIELTINSLALSLSSIIIACALGVLIGIIAKSVAVSAIAAIYGGGQLSAIVALVPLFLVDFENPELIAFGISLIATPIILLIAIILFNKKQL
jgi:ABC-2 type transport system permease protein